MRVCLICNQIAAWGKIGGFGTATRALGRGLVQSGIDVIAVIPFRINDGRRPIEIIDGITVYGTNILQTLFSGKIFKDLEADIYHSQEPTIPTFLAQRAMPKRVHIVTCRDPRGWRDHIVELRHSNLKRRAIALATLYYEASYWVKASVRNADAVLSPAPSALNNRIKDLYGKSVEPRFVPYPVDFPKTQVKKSRRPYIIFVGRFDRRKRVKLFFELAKQFPELKFCAVGEAHDKSYDSRLRRRYGILPNLELPGFIPRFGTPNVSDFYEKAWILVNTSAREGLPYTFIEAAAYEVAICSNVDPDNFASQFGYYVDDGNFSKALKFLLKGNRWQKRGKLAAQFVKKIWGNRNCIDRHIEIYENLLDSPRLTKGNLF